AGRRVRRTVAVHDPWGGTDGSELHPRPRQPADPRQRQRPDRRRGGPGEDAGPAGPRFHRQPRRSRGRGPPDEAPPPPPANSPALIDGAGDPEKMLAQLVRDFTDNIAEAEDAVAQTISNLRLI